MLTVPDPPAAVSTELEGRPDKEDAESDAKRVLAVVCGFVFDLNAELYVDAGKKADLAVDVPTVEFLAREFALFILELFPLSSASQRTCQ